MIEVLLRVETAASLFHQAGIINEAKKTEYEEDIFSNRYRLCGFVFLY